MLSKLLNVGYSKTLSFEEETRVRLLNAFSIILFSVGLFFVLYNLFYAKLYFLALIESTILILVPFIIWCQYKGKYYIAKLIFFVLIHSMIFTMATFLSPGKRVEYFYLVIIMLIMIISKKTFWIYSLVVLDVVLFFIPQLLFNVYPNQFYPYVNSIVFIISSIWILHFFIAIQNQYREKLRFQNERLKAINSEKNDLMSIVAHDLKTPLAQIKGLVSILELEGSQLTKDQIELIEKIKGVTENQHKNITTFLDVETLEKKIGQISYEDFDIVESIKSTLEEMSILSSSKNIKLLDSYDAKNIITYGSEECLVKVISNLVSNAIKYSHRDTIINIDVKSDKNQFLLLIKDQGQGFKKGDLHKVFSKNAVLSAKPTGDETASGVGLYIVKKYVERMNGWVWLKSEEGKGTTFYVKLPRKQHSLV